MCEYVWRYSGGGGRGLERGGEALRGRSECVEKGRGGGVEKFESCLPEGGGRQEGVAACRRGRVQAGRMGGTSKEGARRGKGVKGVISVQLSNLYTSAWRAR